LFYTESSNAPIIFFDVSCHGALHGVVEIELLLASWLQPRMAELRQGSFPQGACVALRLPLTAFVAVTALTNKLGLALLLCGSFLTFAPDLP
jgi:hypothetical protein